MTSCFKTCLKENDDEIVRLNVEKDAVTVSNISTTSPKKEAWGNKAEFILASVGLAVGLGNIWRFPYLCQKNGGGAFLIPYVIMMVIQGFPLFIIEYAIGQRFKHSAIGCWKKIHPALTGVGVASIILSVFLCIYYIAVIAWSLYYMFVSFTKTVPWDKGQCPSNTWNSTSNTSIPHCCKRDSELYYFYEKALGVSSSIESSDGKSMSWQLTLCLLLAWIIVYACVVKGVKSSGKAVYFTATFPYVILIILLIVGATLSGADIGLEAFFRPDFSKLSDPKIWLDAAGQMFFTLSLGFGALIAFASYMPTKNNCLRDAYTVVSINCGTSLLAGMVVFAILGHREKETGQSAVKTGSGPGLVFITFANAFLQMDGTPVWSVLFFLMLVLLGIDSEFGTLEALVYPFYDLKLVSMRKEFFTGLVAIVMFFIGLSVISPPGYYVFQIFDDYSLSFGLLTVAFFQTITVSWVYGNDRFSNDIEYMTGKRPSWLWLACWKYISPIVILIILISNLYLVSSNSLEYKAYIGCDLTDVPTVISKEYPGWGIFIIILFISMPIIPIFYYLLKDLIRDPSAWSTGFKNRFGHCIEYTLDPSVYDLSRRYVVEEYDSDDLTDSDKEKTNPQGNSSQDNVV